MATVFTKRSHARHLTTACAVAALAGLVLQADPAAQRGRAGGAAPSGRTAAPIDITGYWVALVTDDWRYRMLTPPKGNVDYLPVNAAARKATQEWDPARDDRNGEACRAYGAAGVMRLPGRLHITWDGENTLRVETEAGTQTRLFHFGNNPPAPGSKPTWQGHSVARWELPGGRGRGGPVPAGELVVTTTNMRPGYLRKNGVPYSSDAVLTEYVVRLVDGDQQYLALTQFVEDPQYLSQPYVKTYQFRKEADGSAWSPTPCKAG